MWVVIAADKKSSVGLHVEHSRFGAAQVATWRHTLLEAELFSCRTTVINNVT